MREIDTVARLGGDEFAVLMPHTAEADARTTLARVRDQLARTAASEVSIGAVSFSRPLDTVDAMMQEADGVMYLAKRAGKNQVLVAHQG